MGNLIAAIGVLSLLGAGEPHCSEENVVHMKGNETKYEITYLRNDCNYLKAVKSNEEEGTYTVTLLGDDKEITSHVTFIEGQEEAIVRAFNDEGWEFEFSVNGKLVYEEGEMVTNENWYKYIIDEYTYALSCGDLHMELSSTLN